MRLSVFLLAAVLTACGGGGSDEASTPAVDTPATESPATEPTATESPATEVPDTTHEPEVSLSSDAPNNDLTSAYTPTTTATTVCGYSVGANTFTGKVAVVYDGDTITVGSFKVRLDSIDAPELAQTYGPQSKQALSDRILGKTVTVSYAKQDKYGRRVGSAFDSSCALVNLEQVRTGAAWYYEAYKCEISETARNEYASAQAYAQENDLGLWAQAATAPWYYRNGADPEVPNCSSASPAWSRVSGSGSGSSSGSGTAVTTPTVTQCTLAWVNGYRRSNGTYVRGYYRRKPGCT